MKDHPAVREQVRTLYYANGRNLSEAARTANVPIDRAEKWKERGKWDAITTKLDVSEVVGMTADNLASEIQENERETRASLSRYARKASKDSEKASLRDSPYVHKAAQVAGIAFKWDAKEREQSNVVVNIALLGIQPAEVEATTMDADSGVSG